MVWDQVRTRVPVAWKGLGEAHPQAIVAWPASCD